MGLLLSRCLGARVELGSFGAAKRGGEEPKQKLSYEDLRHRPMQQQQTHATAAKLGMNKAGVARGNLASLTVITHTLRVPPESPSLKPLRAEYADVKGTKNLTRQRGARAHLPATC